MKFPVKFRRLIGTEVHYKLGGKLKCTGKVLDLRWSTATIAKIKNNRVIKPEYRGIELKIKLKRGRARWTKPFNSGVRA